MPSHKKSGWDQWWTKEGPVGFWNWNWWWNRFKPSKTKRSKRLRKNILFRNNRRKSINRGRHSLKKNERTES